MAIGNDFYSDQGLTDIENLTLRQAGQSLAYGDQAARYANPFMGERGKYQKQLSDLLADPGSFTSSPVYKFAYDQGLEALNRKGSIRSGNKLAALEKYGQVVWENTGWLIVRRKADVSAPSFAPSAAPSAASPSEPSSDVPAAPADVFTAPAAPASPASPAGAPAPKPQDALR